METWIQMIVTIVCAVLASSSFWAFVQRKSDKNDAEKELLVGLAHDRIVYLGTKYIEREPQYITKEEYENLHDYLYVPYSKCGGNGSAKKVMEEVEKIPLHTPEHISQEVIDDDFK